MYNISLLWKKSTFKIRGQESSIRSLSVVATLLPISPQAAAPAALWAVPSVPRAASAKGPRTSAAAVPDVGESLLPGINGGTWANLHFCTTLT